MDWLSLIKVYFLFLISWAFFCTIISCSIITGVDLKYTKIRWHKFHWQGRAFTFRPTIVSHVQFRDGILWC
jgi:hypothetical protein